MTTHRRRKKGEEVKNRVLTATRRCSRFKVKGGGDLHPQQRRQWVVVVSWSWLEWSWFHGLASWFQCLEDEGGGTTWVTYLHGAVFTSRHGRRQHTSR